MTNGPKPVRKSIQFDSDKVITACIPFILALIAFIINGTISENTTGFERFYASSLNKWMNELLSILTGFFKFSIAEWIFYGHIVIVPFIVANLVIRLFKGGFFRALLSLLQYVAMLYVAFMFLWGFNYQRQSISNAMGFEIEHYSVDELYETAALLVENANELRKYQFENQKGVTTNVGSYKDVFYRAHEGYDAAGELYPVLGGFYGRPKPVYTSELMLETNITGVYFPFTGEANVNIAIPDAFLPATTLHEMAHQRGIAPEDEANFVAYVTAMAHPDKDFNYSGTLMALIHVMNALYAQDPDLASTLRQTYSEGLNRDLEDHRAFWEPYRSDVAKAADRVNDTYLKANGEEQGVKSYGKMVDLVIAYHQYKKLEDSR